MPWELSPLADAGIDRPLLESLLGEHETEVRPALERLWSYYRNPARRDTPVAASVGGRAGTAGGGNPGLSSSALLAQASGLPERLRSLDANGRSREIVIENDIGWRIEALVDFVFGKPLRIASEARDAALRTKIDAALAQVWEQSGGIGRRDGFCR